MHDIPTYIFAPMRLCERRFPGGQMCTIKIVDAFLLTVTRRYEGYEQEDRQEGAAQGLADWFNPGNIIGQLTQDAGQGGGAADAAAAAGKPHDSWRF